MSIALTQLRTPAARIRGLGFALAIVALGGGISINAVAAASRQPLPTVAAQAPQQVTAPTAPQGATGTTDSSSSTSTTNNASSTAFGQQVVQQVQTCKTQAAAAGTHGIGQCVSGWVVQHNGGASHHTSH